jgi:hypothetical protein
MSESILAWHFLEETGCTRRSDGYPPPVRVEVGQTLTETRPLVMCKVGLHASIKALDALEYAPGPFVCRVRMTGLRVTDNMNVDKLCHSRRTVLAMADATELLHEFACWCAETALLRERTEGRQTDPRSWSAINAKRGWLKGAVSTRELEEAMASAWAAAREAESAASWAAVKSAVKSAASGAAWVAACSSAREAACSSARAAACSAAWAAARAAATEEARATAWVAAREAAWSAQNAELEYCLCDLLGIEPGGL